MQQKHKDMILKLLKDEEQVLIAELDMDDADPEDVENELQIVQESIRLLEVQ